MFRICGRHGYFTRTTPQHLEVTPVVYNGVMYVTAANTLTALDARAGRELWKHERAVSSGLIDDAAAHKNRGVGLWKNRVYMETDNAHLLCLDGALWSRALGRAVCGLHKRLWSHKRSPRSEGPNHCRYFRGDSGVRGFLAAFDAETGALAVEVLDHPSTGRTWFCKLAGRRLPAWWRHNVDARHV